MLNEGCIIVEFGPFFVLDSKEALFLLCEDRKTPRRPRETVAQELLIGFDYCPKASQIHGFLSNNQKHSEHPEASKILFIVVWPETMNDYS